MRGVNNGSARQFSIYGAIIENIYGAIKAARGLRCGTLLRVSLKAANDKAQAQTVNRANEKTLALTAGLSLLREYPDPATVSGARGSHFCVVQVGSWNTGSYIQNAIFHI